MNADAFRHFYDYHFSENRTIWDTHVLALSQEQFTQAAEYSRGSVRDQIVHLLNVDESWFAELRNVEPDPLAKDIADRAVIRYHWDEIERRQRDYLAELRDEMLFQKPITDEEDKDLVTWQVLLQVANHGTDHRAQMLRLLNDLGLPTKSQDYVFYAYDHPV